MKRCPQCTRVYADDTLNFCLDDGAQLLLERLPTEPPTLILADAGSYDETQTDHQVRVAAGSDVASRASSAEYIVKEIKQHKRLSIALLAILSLVIIGIGYWIFSNLRGARTAAIESIAVLPFQNASGAEEVEYLSEGITESLINSLTELKQLKVIARSTAFRYKDKDIDPQAVGRELNVRTVLTG
jgi:hypothetical protein